MSNLPPLVRLMRPKQWVKNAFVFAPLLFSGLFTDMVSVQHTLSAFIIFSLASSATYVLNDYNDIENKYKNYSKLFIANRSKYKTHIKKNKHIKKTKKYSKN